MDRLCIVQCVLLWYDVGWYVSVVVTPRTGIPLPATLGPYSNTLAYPKACRQWLEGSTLVLSQAAGTIRVVSDPAGASKSSDEP